MTRTNNISKDKIHDGCDPKKGGEGGRRRKKKKFSGDDSNKKKKKKQAFIDFCFFFPLIFFPVDRGLLIHHRTNDVVDDDL